MCHSFLPLQITSLEKKTTCSVTFWETPSRLKCRKIRWLQPVSWAWFVEVKFHVSLILLISHTCMLPTKHLLKNKRPTWCHLLFYFTSYVLNMFWTLIYPSSGACDWVVELPHRSFCSQLCVGDLVRLGLSSVHVAGCCWVWVVSMLKAEAWNTDTTQTQPHQISNTQRTKNKTTDVVIQQHSHKLLMMDILMSKTCWIHKK